MGPKLAPSAMAPRIHPGSGEGRGSEVGGLEGIRFRSLAGAVHVHEYQAAVHMSSHYIGSVPFGTKIHNNISLLTGSEALPLFLVLIYTKISLEPV